MDAERTESALPDPMEQLEREQARWRELDALLRRLLSRLTYAAEGRNASLDGVLGGIRMATRNPLDEQRIQPLLDA
ncbi:MAG: GGDEF domain-containing protein, partial [Xanthomonadaceae bacterium]|nr:GGDEF domain-containing protein [Xanthomonadaceae bacterium]